MSQPTRGIRLTAAGGVLIIAAMVGLTAASVPLYRLFCQVTGLDGTTQRAESAPSAREISPRMVTVRFNADDIGKSFAVGPNSISLLSGADGEVVIEFHGDADTYLQTRAVDENNEELKLLDKSERKENGALLIRSIFANRVKMIEVTCAGRLITREYPFVLERAAR